MTVILSEMSTFCALSFALLQATQHIAILTSQTKNERGKFFLIQWDLNHGPQEPKSSVLPMSYADPNFDIFCMVEALIKIKVCFTPPIDEKIVNKSFNSNH